jgi:hypothetical protein
MDADTKRHFDRLRTKLAVVEQTRLQPLGDTATA